APFDLCMLITVANRGPEEATLHVLPTLWFRNTWAWGLPGRDRLPVIVERDGALVAGHRVLGKLVLRGDGGPPGSPGPSDAGAAVRMPALFCDNETNAPRLW